MPYDDRDRTLALAGIFQACALVQDLARTGRTDRTDMETSLNSLFMIDSDDVPAVFSGVAGVRRGLEVLSGFAGQGKHPDNLEVLAYVFALMHLARKFLRNKDMVEHMGNTIEGLQRQRDYFEGLDQGDAGISPTVISRLAELYSETISTLQPRVMVKGDPTWLQQEDIVEKIRSLLLAGLRSAVLWYQIGGGRLQFLFRRKRYAALASDLMT